MSITTDKLIDKMDELIKKAKNAPAEQQKGYLIAVQSLIELVVTNDHQETNKITAQPIQVPQYPSNGVQQSPSVSIPQQNTVKMDDANGDSLLDF